MASLCYIQVTCSRTRFWESANGISGIIDATNISAGYFASYKLKLNKLHSSSALAARNSGNGMLSLIYVYGRHSSILHDY
jgi:hypothetical protein